MKLEIDKKLAIFRCCITSMGLEQYEWSSNAVLRELGIEFADIREFNCCGYPLRNISFKAYLRASARNLALAERQESDILTFCSCCYGSLKYADHAMKENGAVRDEINSGLGKEGLTHGGTARTLHFLEVLNASVGVENIRKRVKKSWNGLKVAVHCGCHLLRPRKIVGFEDAFPPALFDTLVEATGAESVSWGEKYECCGSPLLGVNDELSMDLTLKKIESAAEAGADCLCVVCPFCQMQFDRVQKRMLAGRSSVQVPCLTFPHLLGLSLGIEPAVLSVDRNEIAGGTDGHPLRACASVSK